MRTNTLVAAALAAVLSTGTALAQDKVVNVFNWSDYIDPAVLEEFTKETGIKVVYDTMDSNEVLETKLLAGSTGYDIVVPTGSFLQRQIKAGIYLELDKSKLPNLVNVWDKVSTRLAVYDEGNKHAVNYMWGTTGIGYNVGEVKARLGDVPVDSWSIVFDPEKLSKLADCGVYALDAADEIIPAAMNYLGLDPNSKNAEDFEKAGELLDKVRPHFRKFHSSEYINALANGDICLAVGWSGDMFQAKARAIEAHEANKDRPLVDINYVIPKEGALMWFDNMAIPKDAPNVDNAYAFINFMLRPEIAAKNSNFVSYANGNIASKPMIDEAVRNNPSIYPTDEVMAKLYTVTAFDTRSQRALSRVWTRFKTGS